MISGYVPFDMSLPEEGSVFDYCLNLSQYKFVPWSERKRGAGSVSASGYVSIPEVSNSQYYTYEHVHIRIIFDYVRTYVISGPCSSCLVCSSYVLL